MSLSLLSNSPYMATSPCPICFRHVRQENLPLHVEACLTKADSEEAGVNRSQTSRVSTPPSRTKRQPPTPTLSSSGRRSPGSLPTLATTAGAGADKKRRIEQAKPQTNVPLAERMRPSALDEFVGQEELVGPGKLLASLIQADRIPNMILWGYVAVMHWYHSTAIDADQFLAQSARLREDHSGACDRTPDRKQVHHPVRRDVQGCGHAGRHRQGQRREEDVSTPYYRVCG